MLHRSLDVVFQYLFRLAAGIVLVPLLIGGATLALDRSQTVTAKVWADRPLFTPKFGTERFTSYNAPADTEATLMQEVIGSDLFVERVLSRVEPQYGSWGPAHREQAAADFRNRVFVLAESVHVFRINYSTPQPEKGVQVLNAILDAFGVTIQELDTSQLTSVETALRSELDTARQQMEAAVSQAQSYAAGHGTNANDPNYGTLVAQARLKTDRYQSVVDLIEQAHASRTAVLTMQAAVFHVVDSPSLVPRRFSTSMPAFKHAIYAFVGLAAIEALFVYVLARRDPSIRSVEEVRRAVGLKPLGSVPVVHST